jgi:hypothetical protein
VIFAPIAGEMYRELFILRMHQAFMFSVKSANDVQIFKGKGEVPVVTLRRKPNRFEHIMLD